MGNTVCCEPTQFSEDNDTRDLRRDIHSVHGDEIIIDGSSRPARTAPGNGHGVGKLEVKGYSQYMCPVELYSENNYWQPNASPSFNNGVTPASGNNRKLELKKVPTPTILPTSSLTVQTNNNQPRTTQLDASIRSTVPSNFSQPNNDRATVDPVERRNRQIGAVRSTLKNIF